MVIGAGCFSLMFHQEVACWVFAAGALMFVAMQAEQRYDGPDITIRRLRRILLFAGFLFLLSAFSLYSIPLISSPIALMIYTSAKSS